jgi:hypothetical protein
MPLIWQLAISAVLAVVSGYLGCKHSQTLSPCRRVWLVVILCGLALAVTGFYASVVLGALVSLFLPDLLAMAIAASGVGVSLALPVAFLALRHNADFSMTQKPRPHVPVDQEPTLVE